MVGPLSLEECIHRRTSVRSFLKLSLRLDEISQLLWAAGGMTVDGITGPSRSSPSAGGIYPLSIYLVAGRVEGLRDGLYRYAWRDHTLELRKPGDLRDSLARAALSQMFIAEAPATIVIAGDYSKTIRKYGNRGKDRFVPMDAGHAAENLCLQAVAIDLGTVTVGAFDDRAVKRVLDLTEEEPLYLLPFGRPKP
ncbi:MAG TPA: SagB/ThcOx family dehydrogenase [Spirochaetia bacterium]|nr:SagB/ThcOx family dehydrogenase [Spirochaetia bacterium]